MNTKDPKFKALKRKWYTKLAETGFEDIETEEDDLRTFTYRQFTNQVDYHNRGWSVATKRALARTKDSAIEVYYGMVSAYLLVGIFATNYDYLVCVYNAEGLSRRKIAEKLKSHGFKTRTHRNCVQRVIEKQDKAMYTLHSKGLLSPPEDNS